MPDPYELANGSYTRLEHLTAKELRQCLTENPHMKDRSNILIAKLMAKFDWSERRVFNYVERYRT